MHILSYGFSLDNTINYLHYVYIPVVSPQQGRMKALELLQLVSFSVPGVRPLPRGSAAALAQMIDLRNFATVSARYKVSVGVKKSISCLLY